MAIPTYTLISSVTVGSGGASSIDFTSIPATYTDLLVKLSLRSPDAVLARQALLRFNNNSSTIYSYRHLYQDTTTAASSTESNIAQAFAAWFPAANSTSNTFGNAEIYIPNYAGSNNKSLSSDYVGENNASAIYNGLVANIWANTSAINQITFTTNGGNFAQYSTAYLYGIKSS